MSYASPTERPDHGADEQWATDLHAMRVEMADEKAAGLCLCAHPRRDHSQDLCAHSPCGVAQERAIEAAAEARADMAHEIEEEWPHE